MFFTPTKNFSVSDVGGEYVAFLPTAGPPGCGILAPYNSKKGVRVSIDGDFAGLVEAATKQCAVEIEVKHKSDNRSCNDCNDMEWLLHAITIPAAGEAK